MYIVTSDGMAMLLEDGILMFPGGHVTLFTTYAKARSAVRRSERFDRNAGQHGIKYRIVRVRSI